MKKIATFAVCLLVLAGVIRGITGGAGFGPTILTVNVETPDGTDVTRTVRLMVGSASGDPSVAPTLGNISIVKPKMGTQNRFEVAHDRETAVFVFVKDRAPQQFNFRLSGGEERTETIVLDAGWVSMTTVRTSQTTNPSVSHQNETTEGLMVTVFVATGSDQDVVASNLHGKVQFTAVPAVPWADDYPAIRFSPETVEGRGYYNWTDAPEMILPYGTHDMVPRLIYPGLNWRNDNVGPVQEVLVDRELVEVSVPLSVQVILPDVSQWRQEDLTVVDAVLFRTTDVGKPVANARVMDGRAPLVVLSQDETRTYAIALTKRKRIIAFQDVGAVPLNDPKPVAIARGGDFDACVVVAVGYDCETLRP